jgi:hypothetical protein
MEINEWWASEPSERYWIEVTDREVLGSNLIAPKTASNGKATPSYTLVSHVHPGDVVLHWWKRGGGEAAIVGFSTAVDGASSSRLSWQARGTYGRAQAGPRSSPAWEVPLTEFNELERPVSLDRIRSIESDLRVVRDTLMAQHKGALYFPFAFSDKRPVRTAQGYLLKFPEAILRLLPELDLVRSSVPAPEPGQRAPRRGTKGDRRQQDPAVRRAIELHAVETTER